MHELIDEIVEYIYLCDFSETPKDMVKDDIIKICKKYPVVRFG